MTVEHVDVLVEEPSMEAALLLLLPEMLGNISFAVHPHQGKPDLLVRLRERLRGYASWLPSTWRILVLLDRDDEDCQALKGRLETMARDTGLTTRSVSSADWKVVNRLAIEELEAWYFGDWQAVRAAYPRVSPHVPSQARYRDPDAVKGGTCEAFERVMQRAGYFKNGLRKIEAARTIAGHMDPTRNTSKSFQVFRSTLDELVDSAGGQ